MGHWNHQSDPTPFALAEYNARASRAQCWSGGNGVAEMPERQFLQKSISPQRADTSSRVLIATNSIGAGGGCDDKQRADYESRCASRFRDSAVRIPA
jgi:hypothetical protein